MDQSFQKKNYKMEMVNGQYTINGIKYDSVSNIPEEIRNDLNLNDVDGNGLPDHVDEVMESMAKHRDKGTHMSININGKEYGSWEEVPPELQGEKERLDRAMEKLKSQETSDDLEDLNLGNSNSPSPSPPSNLSGPEGKLKWIALTLIFLALIYYFFWAKS